MIENHYKVHLWARKVRFSSEWDFYLIASTQHWREVFKRACKKGKSVKVWIPIE